MHRILGPSRPGHFVLACGLRTLAPAFPPLESQADDGVVIICGEPGELREGLFAGGGRPGGYAGGYSGVGSLSRILNASRLEVKTSTTMWGFVLHL